MQRQVTVLGTVSFSGRDRIHVKRKALDYWFQHRDQLRLSMRDFLAQCRLSGDECTITFTSR